VIEQIKASVYFDGAAYLRFDVHEDFDAYWGGSPTEEPYVVDPGSTYRGGHAVLMIGWDDDKGATGAFLCKNSWGTGGPRGDGSFWLGYEALNGETELGVQVANLGFEDPYEESAAAAKVWFEGFFQNADPRRFHGVGHSTRTAWVVEHDDPQAVTGALITGVVAGTNYGRGTTIEVDVSIECVEGGCNTPDTNTSNLNLLLIPPNPGPGCNVSRGCAKAEVRSEDYTIARLESLGCKPGQRCTLSIEGLNPSQGVLRLELRYQDPGIRIKHFATRVIPSN
jgi:hypothetical protein